MDTQAQETTTEPITGNLDSDAEKNAVEEEVLEQQRQSATHAANTLKQRVRRKEAAQRVKNWLGGWLFPKQEEESGEQEEAEPAASNGRGSGRGRGRGRIYAMPQPEPDKRSAIEKMRDKVAEMDEDYKDAGERILGFFIQLVGYVGPFLFVVWVGSDLGKYFAPVMDSVPAYGLSYTMEAVIAACTVSMGRAFAEIASGKARYGSAALVVLVWLVLNAGSALMLYLVITHNNQVTGFEQFSMMVRVIAIALGDLGCSVVLMFKGRSLQRHIDSVRKRASAISELADAQRSIEEADKNAELREQMMKATLKIQEDLSGKIGDAVSMVMTSILERMEKALKEDGRSDRRYGTK